MKKMVVVLLHLGYWLMYLLLLLVFIRLFSVLVHGLKQHGLFYGIFFFWGPIMLGGAIIPGVFSFYAYYTWLYTQCFSRRKILLLFVYGIAVAIVAALLGDAYFTVVKGRNALFAGGWTSAIELTEVMALVALLNGVIGLVIRGFITSWGDIKLKEDLNRKNHEMEMALIKSHINPHFLFNTINNIDVLIEKDPLKASAYLNKLSGIMRFMLYETKPDQIPLAKELAYIEKYIDLQKIRTANPDYVHYTVDGDPGNRMVAPMLFIAFIENAFKHAENKKAENAIGIRFTIRRDEIIFDCDNMYTAVAAVKPLYGGLGNELIQKRLALLYPGKHLLQTGGKAGTYKVKLTLFANED